MVQEGPEWAKLRATLKGAREARDLKLEQVASGLVSKSYLSRMESGARPLTRRVIQRYASLTGYAAFVTAFDYLVAKDENPDAAPEDLPHLGAVLASVEVHQTIRINELVEVDERRVVVPKVHEVRATSVGMHFAYGNGRRPRVRPAEAEGAEIIRQGWANRTDYVIALRFPDPIVAGSEPSEFTLKLAYEVSKPLLGLVPSDPVTQYHVSVTLPPFATDVFEFNGVLPQVAEELVESIGRGDDISVRSRSFDAGAHFARDFLDLKPARLYGFAWVPRGRASAARD